MVVTLSLTAVDFPTFLKIISKTYNARREKTTEQAFANRSDMTKMAKTHVRVCTQFL